MDIPATSLQLRTLLSPTGTLRIFLQDIATPMPAADEILVQIQAAPINPSDLGLLLGPTDLSTLQSDGSEITAIVPPAYLPGLQARFGQSLPVGNEAAGLVVRAGAEAQHLLGRTVAMVGGAMFSQYRCIKGSEALPLPADVSAAQGASCFVNPLTALGMVETMRAEHHTALVHTAAASNLGQMLIRLCLRDGIALVNIVRNPDQAALLRGIGATYVCDSSAPGFTDDLTEALAATGATIAFDAIGGGPLTSQILNAMEAAASRDAGAYSRYGSTVHKQVYVYGGLDMRPITLTRGFGFAWGVAGWLLFGFLQKIGPAAGQALRARVIAEIKTTFASHYSREISLAQALDPEIMAAYARRSTGEKYLIVPDK